MTRSTFVLALLAFAACTPSGESIAQLPPVQVTPPASQEEATMVMEFIVPEAYDCAGDEALAAAPATAAADTIQVAQAVRGAFPGWHLSTEREIACRFPMLGQQPWTHWPEMGSGRAWWVWTGDFDGDGREDRATLLTSDEDPEEDRLVVLFASGEAAEVAPVAGYGVDVARAEPRDLLAVIYWDSAAETYEWDGERFQMAEAID